MMNEDGFIEQAKNWTKTQIITSIAKVVSGGCVFVKLWMKWGFRTPSIRWVESKNGMEK
jgi:hypothetical protein